MGKKICEGINDNVVQIGTRYVVWLLGKQPFIIVNGKKFSLDISEDHVMDVDGDTIEITSVSDGLKATSLPSTRIFSLAIGTEITDGKK